jgi:hypothetical protein
MLTVLYDKRQNYIKYAEAGYADCCYPECRFAVVILSAMASRNAAIELNLFLFLFLRFLL